MLARRSGSAEPSPPYYIIRAPLIVRRPGVTSEQAVCDQPVYSCDLVPRLLKLTGMPARLYMTEPANHDADGKCDDHRYPWHRRRSFRLGEHNGPGVRIDPRLHLLPDRSTGHFNPAHVHLPPSASDRRQPPPLPLAQNGSCEGDTSRALVVRPPTRTGIAQGIADARQRRLAPAKVALAIVDAVSYNLQTTCLQSPLEVKEWERNSATLPTRNWPFCDCFGSRGR